MLTINEKRWLVQRKGYCNWCSVKFKTDSCFWVITAGLCPLYPRQVSTQDAAEFSERVAAKLAINDTSYLPCHQKGHENQCPYDNYCPTDKKKTAWCKLKHARLQVEEEMDAD
jgi:hypothetical protein